MTPPIALAVITSPRGVLLGRRADGSWVFPGGKLEQREDCAQAAAREAFEEAGLTVRTVRHLGSRVHPATRAPVNYVACTVLSGEARAQEDSGLEEVRWVGLQEADDLTGGAIYGPVRTYLAAVLQ